MTRHLSKRHVALAVVLSIIVVSGAAAGEKPYRTVTDTVSRVAASAPHFDPKPPGAGDEFFPNSNVKSVHFDFDKATIRPGDALIVESNATWLKANAPYDVMIEGYADERGTPRYNTALAKRRAEMVREQLVANGVDLSKIIIVSHGEARPACYTKAHNEACWAKARRVDFFVKRAPTQSP